MHDVQQEEDTRGVPINRVGVRGLSYPIRVRDKANKWQHTIATVTLAVALRASFKGTHMSRFIGVLNNHRNELAADKLPDLLCDMLTALDSDHAYFAVEFPYFIEREAPVTRNAGLMEYRCSLAGTMTRNGEELLYKLKVGVRVPVTSLCPCSKAISERGAHNQRGYVTITVEPKPVPGIVAVDHVWFEELIQLAEASASCPVYPLLKREDERWVTEHAYDNPVFVEDVVRNIAVSLRDHMHIEKFIVRADNEESIHNHVAFAEVIGP